MEIIYLSYILSFLFLFIAIVIYKGYRYESKIKHTTNTTSKLSIIIAAKNEETNINSLVDSIEQLDYPKKNFEVIFVDDNSNDKTVELIQSRISDKNNFNLIRAINKEIDGKKGALSIGISNAIHNFILITDADCKPGSKWLKAMAGCLDYGYDFVFGVAPIESGAKLVEKLSAFENLRNTFLSISAVGLNMPYSAAARSFAFRKKSFERIGGYANTTEILSGDDDLLLREAVKNKMLIGTVVDLEAFVYSSAPKNFADYFKQKKRHLQTSFHYQPKQKMFLGFWHTLNLISFLSFLLFFISPVFVLPFAVKLIYDFFVATKYQQKIGHSFKFYEIIYLQLILEFFIVVNFFNSLLGKIEWK